MQFNVFKGAKRFTTTLTTSTPDSTIYTTTRDSLIFCNVYNTSSSFGFNDLGIVYFATQGFGASFPQRKSLIWKAREYYLSAALGGGASGAFVPSGTDIKQSLIWVAGTIKIDLYVLEMNDNGIVQL